MTAGATLRRRSGRVPFGSLPRVLLRALLLVASACRGTTHAPSHAAPAAGSGATAAQESDAELLDRIVLALLDGEALYTADLPPIVVPHLKLYSPGRVKAAGLGGAERRRAPLAASPVVPVGCSPARCAV